MIKKRKYTKLIIISTCSLIIFSFIFLNYYLPENIKKNLKIPRDSLLYINIFNNKKNNNEVLLKYEHIINKNKELESEINILKKQLNLNSILLDHIIINATTINRNIEYFNNSLTIDKGSFDGIELGMGVLSNEYFIGKITEVSYKTSKVTLLSNNTISKLSIKLNIDNREIYGLLHKNNKNIYIVEGITDIIDIPIDSYIYTTGFNDNIPSGLKIGKVKKVMTDNFDLAKQLEIELGTNLNDISYVMVVGKK